MGGIFISYRRADTEADAGRLYGDLASEFGDELIFKDVDKVPLGVPIRPLIEDAIARSSVVLVLVGPHWMAGDRIQHDRDWVRFEIEAALAKGKSIIPVRIRRAELPTPESLPLSIRQFVDLNSAELEHSSWTRDLAPLIRAIRSRADSGVGLLPPNTPPLNRPTTQPVDRRSWHQEASTTRSQGDSASSDLGDIVPGRVRLRAHLFDGGIPLTIFLVGVLASRGLDATGADSGSTVWIAGEVLAVVWVLANSGILVGLSGQSLGRKRHGMRLVRSTPRRAGPAAHPTIAIALLRAIFAMVSGLLSLGIVPILSFGWIAMDPDRRSLFDRVFRQRLVTIGAVSQEQ